MKRILSLALAALMVAAIPSAALAATDSGTTDETLTIASTVSMVVPASATFMLESGTYTHEGFITIVGSNNPTGVTITATVTPWQGPGSIVVPTTARGTHFSSGNQPEVLVKRPSSIAVGQWLDSTTPMLIASSEVALANATVGVGHSVAASYFSVGGEYNSSVSYTVTTNPLD